MKIKPLKLYYCPDRPGVDDVDAALKIARNEDCYVRIEYSVFGYHYSVFVDPSKTFNDAYKQIPDVFGM